jgi:tRNA-2-methylthio-N6-dimethylallyladenosine synthase
MKKKIFIKTYGCQMNVYDSIKMGDVMAPFGYEVTEDMQEAYMVVLNTCHIREKAAEKTYSELGRIRALKEEKKAKGENLIIVVAGCVGQAEGEEIFARAHYVDIVVGPQSYYVLPSLAERIEAREKHLIELDFVEEEKFDKLPESKKPQGSSSIVSVQEGCDKFCTFCVVPYTRGAEFSRPVEKIYREVSDAVAKGAVEIVLLGQNVNAYHGKAESGGNFSLAQIIDKIAGINDLKRIRYTTSHPKDMSEDLIKIHGSEQKLMPFLHLPIQSGSDKVLKLMNRRHNVAEYMDIMDKLREARPDIALSSDFIVGFPGESDKDFEDTLDIVRKVKYSQCYSFKYSPRPGTPGATRDGQIPEQLKSERLKILQEEISKQQMEFNLNSMGKEMEILLEKTGSKPGQLLGKSPYMQSVHIEADKELLGSIVKVKINKILQNSMSGEVSESDPSLDTESKDVMSA